MNPESWHSISTVFLIVGIIFFILTVWLSVKFNLLSIIKSEISNRKERQNSDENDYFIINQNSNSNSSENAVIYNSKNNIVSSLSNQEESNVSNTVLAPKQEELNVSNTILVSEESNGTYEEHHKENDDFIISENIIVIHGDPSAIRRKVAL
ncbi:MAG: hypothetical protein K2I80_06365 [Ruminococcus sp.]|nr:hypothetical protein [Ruminococcus sp.]MDE6848449.1 hypothetical protein [Ruminococcus sp.]